MLGLSKSKHPVLIVDDEQVVADGLKKYFEANGLPAEACYSAAELRERFASSPPRALVLDVNLGDADGIEMIHEVKNAWPDVPVVILTAMGYEDTLMEQAKSQHAQGYVSKSVPPSELLAKVIGILKHPEHHD